MGKTRRLHQACASGSRSAMAGQADPGLPGLPRGLQHREPEELSRPGAAHCSQQYVFARCDSHWPAAIHRYTLQSAIARGKLILRSVPSSLVFRYPALQTTKHRASQRLIVAAWYSDLMVIKNPCSPANSLCRLLESRIIPMMETAPVLRDALPPGYATTRSAHTHNPQRWNSKTFKE